MSSEEDSYSRRDRSDTWECEEITALLTVWKKYVAELDRAGHKRPVYRKMSEKLKGMGLNRDHYAVQLKINKLKGLYRKSMPSSGNKSKWKYWAQVDEILGEPDSEESSYEEEGAEEEDEENTDSDDYKPPVQTKKMQAMPAHLPTRNTPQKANEPAARPLTQSAKRGPKPKPKPPVTKPERPRKPPPPDEFLDNLLKQDRKLKEYTLKLIHAYKDTAAKIASMQKTCNENMIALATEFERYLKAKKSDPTAEETIEDRVNALLDNDITNVSLNHLLPQIFKNDALMPLLKTVLGQFAPPQPEHQNTSNVLCMM